MQSERHAHSDLSRSECACALPVMTVLARSIATTRRADARVSACAFAPS